MALQNLYKRWLAHPTTDALAADASLVYVPTLTTFREPTAILKHIRSQEQQLQKKNDSVLNALESSNGLCLETNTTIRFVSGGGAYLPGMDDNLLADKEISVVVVHVVSFDASNQIKTIRLFWDQGSVLKSVDVIGRTGRNWPLHTGIDQARVIASTATIKTLEDTPELTTIEMKRPQPAKRTSDANAMREILSPSRHNDQDELPSNAVGPRETARPAPRDYNELFASAESAAKGLESPAQRSARLGEIKAGAGKNFSQNRLFDEASEEPLKPHTPSIKTNPNKYDHFEFADPDQQPLLKAQATRPNKFASQWEFADFSTPVKAATRQQPNTTRNFSWEGEQKQAPQTSTENQRPIAKSRPGTTAQFQFNSVTPEAQRDHATQQAKLTGNNLSQFERPAPKARVGTTAQFEFNGVTPEAQKHSNVKDSEAEHGRALGNITNVDQNRRNFASHWEMTDNRTVIDEQTSDENAKTKTLAGGKKNQEMHPSWALFDDVSEVQKPKGIRVAGNGMGAPLASNEDGVQQSKGIKIAGNGMGGRRDFLSHEQSPPKSKGIKIAGNGMGGPAGSGGLWEF